MAPFSKNHLHEYFYAPLFYRKISLISSNTDPPVSGPGIHHNIENHILLPRTTHPINPGVGVTPPEVIPNKFVFTLFGLIGASFVCTAVWFFFRAKNGGFHFKSTDWEDYKSSVLRRSAHKGTNTMSAISASTAKYEVNDEYDGGCGDGGFNESKRNRSIRSKKKRSKQQQQRRRRRSTTSMTTNDICGDQETIQTSEMSEISEIKHEIEKEKMKKENNNNPTKGNKSSRIKLQTVDEELNKNAQDDLIAYRYEKAATVGGLNIESEASTFDGSTTNGSTITTSSISEVIPSPRRSPTKVRKYGKDLSKAGIRKVVSVSENKYKNNIDNDNNNDNNLLLMDTPRHDLSRSKKTKKEKSSKSKKPYLLEGKEQKALKEEENLEEEEGEGEDVIKKEAKRLQEIGRTAQRREFSFKVGDDGSVISSYNKKNNDNNKRTIRNSGTEYRRNSRLKPITNNTTLDSSSSNNNNNNNNLKSKHEYEEIEEDNDIGTKAYPHSIPELTGNTTSSTVTTTTTTTTTSDYYAEEKRRKRNESQRNRVY